MSSHSTSPPTNRRFDEDQLLDAARNVFFTCGYSAAQIVDIASKAGTTKPTLYSRIGGKEQIYMRVVEREAAMFRHWIADTYQHCEKLSLKELSHLGMEPLFRFATDRTEGFTLLFRGDMTGDTPATIRRDVIRFVVQELTKLINQRQKTFTRAFDTETVEGLAAACVGVAVQVCENAIDSGHDLDRAHELATRFVYGAFHSMTMPKD